MLKRFYVEPNIDCDIFACYEWIEENINTKVYPNIHYNNNIRGFAKKIMPVWFSFENEEDAMAFKLRWL